MFWPVECRHIKREELPHFATLALDSLDESHATVVHERVRLCAMCAGMLVALMKGGIVQEREAPWRLTEYQRGIIALWIDEAQHIGMAREDSLASTLSMVDPTAADDVRRIYDARWKVGG